LAICSVGNEIGDEVACKQVLVSFGFGNSVSILSNMLPYLDELHVKKRLFVYLGGGMLGKNMIKRKIINKKGMMRLKTNNKTKT
jgi:hypothetical protein